MIHRSVQFDFGSTGIEGFDGALRDLKPDNFLIGREPSDKTIYVIDLGMAKVYRDERDIHIPWRTNKGFWGNPRYASVSAHQGDGLLI
jgi:serine/threonine protein kinase